MLLGDRPVRDFSDPGWPLTYVLSAAAWRVAGDAMAVEWVLTALGFAAGAAFTLLVAYRLSGSLGIAVLVTALEIVISPRTYAYPKIVAYACAAWVMLKVAAHPSTPRIVLLSAVTAIAFLLRHDHGLYIGVASAVCIAMASRADGARQAVRRAAILTCVTAVFLLPWLLFVAGNGGIPAYFQTALEYARAEAEASNLRSWPTFSIAPRLASDQSVDAWLYWLFWTLPSLCGALVLPRWRRGNEQWRGELAVISALVVLGFCVNAGFLRDVLRTRFSDAIVPPALLGAWALGLCWVATWRPRWARMVINLAVAGIVITTAAAISRVAGLPEQLNRTDIHRGLNGMGRRTVGVASLLRLPHRQPFYPPSRMSAALLPFFSYLDRCTSAADRLIVTGEFPDVIVLAGRRFASDGAVLGAWYSSVANQSRTVERMRRRPPLFAIMMSRESFVDRFPAIDTYITREFEPMSTVSAADSEFPILVHGGRRPLRTDPVTQWPCFQ